MIVLARSLVEEFTVDGEAVAVVGMLRGRDPAAMLEALQSAGVRSVVACAPDSPRALPAEVVAEAALGLGMEVRAAPTVAEAVAVAVDSAGPDDRCSSAARCTWWPMHGAGWWAIASEDPRSVLGCPSEDSAARRISASLPAS